MGLSPRQGKSMQTGFGSWQSIQSVVGAVFAFYYLLGAKDGTSRECGKAIPACLPLSRVSGHSISAHTIPHICGRSLSPSLLHALNP
jgi:hypothetical protein